MTTNNRNVTNYIRPNQAVFAAVFATVAMTGYLWSQIVTGLGPPVV